MSLGGEAGSVQRPFLRYAEEAGWTYLTPELALDLRRGSPRPVRTIRRSLPGGAICAGLAASRGGMP